jgi:hypothetical protein
MASVRVADAPLVATPPRAAASADAPSSVDGSSRSSKAPTSGGVEPLSRSGAAPAGAREVSAAEAAAQVAAGITRTESAFEYGKTLWDRTWRSGDAYVAATGSVVQPEATTGDVLDVLERYRDEPRLGTARVGLAALGANQEGGVSDVDSRGARLPSARVGLGLAAGLAGLVGLAGLLATRRGSPSTPSERFSLTSRARV